MQVFEFDSWATRQYDDLLRSCWLYDERIKPLLKWSEERERYCSLCESMEQTEILEDPSFGIFNTNESVLCSRCKMNTRVRGVLSLAREHLGARTDKTVYLTEQVTHTFAWMQNHWPVTVVGSEYESDPDKLEHLTEKLHALGGTGQVQFNDLTGSRFEDSVFDAIVSFEVLEHIPDFRKALSEMCRNLKQGGKLFATLPFADTEKTLVRARINEMGTIDHLMEPEYHGDTISGGILCFYHFGWDLLEVCVASGFRTAKMVMAWNPAAGMHFGQWVLVATK